MIVHIGIRVFAGTLSAMSSPGRRVRLQSAWVLLATGVIGTLAWFVIFTDRDRAGVLVGVVIVVIVAAADVVVWLRRRGRPVLALTDQLDLASDALAVAVTTQWEHAATQRRLISPTLIPVRWQSTPAVAGPAEDAVGDPARHPRFAALPGMTPVRTSAVQHGGLRDLFRVYAGVDSGQMIILGPPGAGKSASAILLLLDALQHRQGLDDARRALTPVPVLLSAHGWNPKTEPLDDWLAAQLGRNHPFLRSDVYGPSAPAKLVSSGRVALILDGFDDIPERIRHVALRALGERARFRLVLLTRNRELVEATGRSGPLRNAAALELLPVCPTDAADYLARCQAHSPPPPWQLLIDHVRSSTADVVTVALGAPLTLTLVRDTFPTASDLDELLTSGRFNSRDEVEDYLLDRVISAAYRHRPGQPKPPCSVEQADRWLGWLAAQMRQRHSRDLAWWQIPRWKPATFRVVTSGLVGGLVSGLGTGIVGSLVGGLGVGLASGFGFGLLGGLIGGLAGRANLESEPEFKPEVSSEEQPRRLAPLEWDVLFGESNAIVTLLFGVMFGNMGGVTFGFASGFPSGFGFGLVLGLMIGLVEGLTCPASDATGPLDPRASWSCDRSAGLMSGLVFGLMIALLVGFMGGIMFGPGHVSQLGLVLMLGPGLGLTFGFMDSATWRTTLVLLQLRLNGTVPGWMLRLLEDAHSREVLHTIGPVYQFRHARLQDRLAEAHQQHHS